LIDIADRLEAWLQAQSKYPMRWFAPLAVLIAVQINPWWTPTPDSTVYLSIARSIAGGHGLRTFGYPHIAYPPGYPILVSPAFWLSPLPFLAIAAIHCVMTLLFMAGLYRWMKFQASTGAVVLTLLVMVNVTFWIYYHHTLSELAFMTTAIWAVVFLDQALDLTLNPGCLRDFLAGIALLILLTLIREAGVLFALALGVTIGLRALRGSISVAAAVPTIAVILLPATAAVVGFLVYTERTFAATQLFGTHLSAFFDSRISPMERLADGTRLQICGVGRLIVPGMFKAYGHVWLDTNTIVYSAAVLALAIGWYHWVRRRPDPYALVVPFYLLLYAFWDFDADTRYILPLLPAVVVCLWYLIEPFKLRLTSIATLATLHLAVALTYWTCVELPRTLKCNAQRESIAQLVGAVDKRPGLIAATAEVPECARLFFSLMLDRPVIAMHSGSPTIERPKLLLTTVAASPTTGFHRAKIAGDYVLLVESEPTIAR